MVRDIAEDSFQQDVIERSREVPVVVDFWAEWCGPCKRLGPALEAEAAKREGDVELAKVDVDSNQGLAASFGVQGIPAVKAFKDGEVVAEFTGAIPPAQVEEFFDGIVPSEAARLADADDEASLRRAVELDPRQSEAAVKLARILIARDEDDEARDLLEPLDSDFIASGLLARLELEADDAADGDLSSALEAWDAENHEGALESLQAAIASTDDSDRVDLLRRVMVAIFTELGPGSDLARDHRRRLALAIS
jgi:putative thioredoxin